MGVCYLLANHTKHEYLSEGLKFSEMDYPAYHLKLFYLLTYFWDLRVPQSLEWISDANDEYDDTKMNYRNVGPDLQKEFDEWEASRERPTDLYSHVYTCEHCDGLRCVHTVYGHPRKDGWRRGATDENCVYLKCVRKAEVEHCPICGRECPEYEYNPDKFWHDKTICEECGEKMPCYQQFKKALESGELQKELDRLDREEREEDERKRET